MIDRFSTHAREAVIAHGDGVAAHVLEELGVDLENAATATTHVRFPTAVRDQPAPWPPQVDQV